MEPIEDVKVLETPTGAHKVTFKAYICGADRRSNRRFIMNLDEAKRGTVDGIDEAENQLLRLIVIAIDGTSDDIVDRVLKMRAADYDFVMETANSIVKGLDDKKKQISGGSTPTSSEEGS